MTEKHPPRGYPFLQSIEFNGLRTEERADPELSGGTHSEALIRETFSREAVPGQKRSKIARYRRVTA